MIANYFTKSSSRSASILRSNDNEQKPTSIGLALGFLMLLFASVNVKAQTQLIPTSDGTFNGQLMPSTDYWFKVEYPEAGVVKEFKAHFSLKR